MRFRDSWFLRAGFLVLLLSVVFLICAALLKERWPVQTGSASAWEMVSVAAGVGLQCGAVLMIIGVTMTLYRKAQLKNPRLH